MRANSSKRATAALMIATALIMAACSSSTGKSSSASTNTSSSTTKVKRDATIAKMVPEKYRSKGQLVVAMGQNFPPQYFVQRGELVGWNPDLARAVGAVLGLQVKVTGAPFSTLIPGLQNGRFDAAFAAMDVTPERKQEIDMVSYYKDGVTFITKASDSNDVRTPTDLCGRTVAAVVGSVYVGQIADFTKTCRAQGKSAIRLLTFPDQSTANLAVGSGRADAVIAGQDSLSYVVKQTGKQYKLSSLVLTPSVEAVGLAKGSGLARPIQAALEKLKSEGIYAAILEKWAADANAVTIFKINPS